jgi:hypothetical protein
VATMIGGGLEGCGPSQPWPAVNWHHCTAPTERTPSRESAGNGPCGRGNDDRWGPGGLAVPSQPLLAANRHHITAPTERTPSRESAIDALESYLRIYHQAHLLFKNMIVICVLAMLRRPSQR